MTTKTEPAQLSLVALFLKFLHFGALAFGGPVAQIAMVRQALIEEERWISPERFNRLLSVMQVLPGPEAHELCVHLGIVARGRIGGLLAGLGFMLPGFFLMLCAAWVYVNLLPHMLIAASLLLGIQIVVVAIITRAIHKIGVHIVTDYWLWALAIGGFAMTLLGVPFWLPLVAAGLIYRVRQRLPLAFAATAAAIAAGYLLNRGISFAPAVPVAAIPVTTLALFITGLKGGLLTFGGAYTAIPYVRADTVGRGWLTDGSFLDGVAVAGILPAPLVIFATFAGYVAGGWTGAVAITAGMFLPAFAFSIIFFERLEAIVENPDLHDVLTGVAAAVVGIIAATCVQLGLATAGRTHVLVPAAILFIAALAGAWRLKGKFVAPLLLTFGGATGMLLQL